MSRSRGSSVQPRNHFGVFGTSIWHHKPDPAVAEPIAIGASTVRPSATRRAYLRTTLSPPPRSRYAPTCRPVTTHTMSFWDPCGPDDSEDDFAIPRRELENRLRRCLEHDEWLLVTVLGNRFKDDCGEVLAAACQRAGYRHVWQALTQLPGLAVEESPNHSGTVSAYRLRPHLDRVGGGGGSASGGGGGGGAGSGYSALKPGEARLKARVVEVLGAAVDDAGGSVDAASAGAKLLREVPEFKSLASDGKLKTLVNSGELPGFIWVPDPLKAKAGRDTIRRQPLQPLDNRGVDASSAVNSAELRAATAESFIAHLRIRGDPARLCSNKDEFTAQFNEWKDFEKNRLLMRTSGNFVVTLLVVC